MSGLQRYLRCARSGDMRPDSKGAWCKYDDVVAETSDDIQKETERIHQGIVESLSFSEALAKRDNEIKRLAKELESADRIANDWARQNGELRTEIERLREELRLCIHVDKHIYITSGLHLEIERLRALLRECLPHFERGQPTLWKRVREALRDAAVRQSNDSLT